MGLTDLPARRVTAGSQGLPSNRQRSQLPVKTVTRSHLSKGESLRYISIFSGIEAASVAWGPLGWQPVAFSEIDEFPSAVLRARYPDVPNLGDITKVDWSPYRGAVDLVIGGSPCQSFSIAGKREGLAGASGLMFEYIRCIRDVMPEWLIWENVPGSFSVERGNAFKQLLESLDELGYGLAWRVLDAQFFGVAQRRRRVFLVGHLGDMRACEVLFEPESVSGDTTSSKQKREALAADARSRAARTVQCVMQYGDEMAGTLRARYDSSPTPDNGQNAVAQTSVLAFAQNTRDEVRIQGDGTISGALAAQPGMKQQTYVMRVAQTGANGCGVNTEIAHTIDTAAPEAVAQPIAMASGQANAEICEGGVAPTLTVLHEAPLLATALTCSQASAQQTAASSSSTTRASAAADSCSTRDRGGFDPICVADDNAHAAIDENFAGSLKVGGGQPFVAFPLTERT